MTGKRVVLALATCLVFAAISVQAQVEPQPEPMCMRLSR